MSWIDKIKAGIRKKSPKDEDLWVNCKKCKEQIYIAELEDNLKVCPKCEYHFRLDARQKHGSEPVGLLRLLPRPFRCEEGQTGVSVGYFIY